MFMIIWLASYPRSGNTFFRALLHRLFGFQTHSVYPEAKSTEATPADIRAMQRLVGGEELERDLGELESESRKYFIKTHDLPKDDTAPAVVLVRDGRDALVSYTHFVLRTARGIEHATSDVFEATLEEIIVASHFGGWSANVNAWIERAGWDSVVRYEELIQDPVNIVVGALREIGSEQSGEWRLRPFFPGVTRDYAVVFQEWQAWILASGDAAAPPAAFFGKTRRYITPSRLSGRCAILTRHEREPSQASTRLARPLASICWAGPPKWPAA